MSQQQSDREPVVPPTPVVANNANQHVISVEGGVHTVQFPGRPDLRVHLSILVRAPSDARRSPKNHFSFFLAFCFVAPSRAALCVVCVCCTLFPASARWHSIFCRSKTEKGKKIERFSFLLACPRAVVGRTVQKTVSRENGWFLQILRIDHWTLSISKTVCNLSPQTLPLISHGEFFFFFFIFFLFSMDAFLFVLCDPTSISLTLLLVCSHPMDPVRVQKWETLLWNP